MTILKELKQDILEINSVARSEVVATKIYYAHKGNKIDTDQYDNLYQIFRKKINLLINNLHKN